MDLKALHRREDFKAIPCTQCAHSEDRYCGLFGILLRVKQNNHTGFPILCIGVIYCSLSADEPCY